MFGWLNRPLRKSKQKVKQQPPREVNDGLTVPDKAPEEPSSVSLRLLIKTAIADAEQIAASIKTRAQTEAEAEAARIIDQAKLEAEEIKGSAKITALGEVDNIISTANKKAEIVEIEAKQKTLQLLIRATEEAAKEIGGEYKKAYSRLSASLQDLMDEGQNIETELKDRVAKLRESGGFELEGYESALLSTSELVVSPTETRTPVEALEEVVAEPVGQHIPEEKAESVEPEPVPVKLDSKALYTGEVELLIASPVELQLVSRLYNYLQTVPELRIFYARGSWDQGTTITVVLDKPLSLIAIISETPGVAVIAELVGKDGMASGRTGSPLRAGEKVTRMKLILKEA